MPAKKHRLFLLAYDIANPKRLTQVHRTVRAHGLPLQYSVFLVPGTAQQIDDLRATLAGIIEPTEDDIRIYPLPTKLDVVAYGRQWAAEGISLIGDDLLANAMTALAQAADTG